MIRMKPFRYFANPTQHLSSWSQESGVCHLCKTVGSGFDGPLYGEDDVERVCEACLRDGGWNMLARVRMMETRMGSETS